MPSLTVSDAPPIQAEFRLGLVAPGLAGLRPVLKAPSLCLAVCRKERGREREREIEGVQLATLPGVQMHTDRNASPKVEAGAWARAPLKPGIAEVDRVYKQCALHVGYCPQGSRLLHRDPG